MTERSWLQNCIANCELITFSTESKLKRLRYGVTVTTCYSESKADPKNLQWFI